MSRIRAAVGSRNPVKVEAARAALQTLVPEAEVRGVEVRSGVADQPRSDEEALKGAEQRAAAALESSGAAYGIGIESGVDRVGGRLYGFTWAVIRDRDGRTGRGSSARFLLPPEVERALERGLELDAAMHAVTGVAGLGRAEGAMGYLTGGRVTREEAARQAMLFALAPLLHPELYPSEG